MPTSSIQMRAASVPTRRPTSVRAVASAAVAMLLVSLSPTPIAASLGGDSSSVTEDRVRMQGSLRQIVQHEPLTVHELQSASGVIVREYIGSSGTVVGVAWEGGTLPDLRQLLGVYFDRFQQEAERQARLRRGHGPLTVDLGDVVVQSGGHPRGFAGHAYLSRSLPIGVAADSIR